MAGLGGRPAGNRISRIDSRIGPSTPQLPNFADVSENLASEKLHRGT